MLDVRIIRESPDLVKHAVEVKGIDLDVDALVALDAETRRLRHEVDNVQGERKRRSKEFGRADEATREKLRAEQADFDARLTSLREEHAAKAAELQELMLQVPGIPWDGSPVGAGEAENVVIKQVGTPPTFDFEPLDHVALLEERGWAEFARARNVSGERAYALRGDAVLLERALLSFALDLLIARHFTPISVPSLVREGPLVGTGMFPKGREETYELPADDLFLAGTGEVALVGLHAGEILDKAQLPVLYAGISPCFRREIGSAGRDVRGLIRVHQFEKVEQFVICEADDAESERWHQALLDCAEQVLVDLDLAYEVVECSTGDMGLGKFRMNDINTWFPSLDSYRETHSCSTLHDWQARRANLRYRDADGTIRHAHTLNNTAVATPRLLAAVIENHQTADRRIAVPEALRPYLHGREVL
ncbi:serine--tRNA ligase [Nocardioides sp. GXZ039]|uniref:serine--tRNA ligase n=1 Tax=Nocardioides sp. GXZ039 TaxID=3136018 RepID=UPI0030F4035C